MCTVTLDRMSSGKLGFPCSGISMTQHEERHFSAFTFHVQFPVSNFTSVSTARYEQSFTFSLALLLSLSRLPLWSSSQEFLAANPQVPGSIPGPTRFSKQQWVCNGIHSALVRINEELLERKVAAPVLKTEINGRMGSAALTTRHPSNRKSWH
jgi:hypothetical protein